jgi:hypothetical protein
MKLKLLVSRGGPGVNDNAGDEIDVSDAEGARMIEAGHAVPVRGAKAETTTKKTPAAEKASKD